MLYDNTGERNYRIPIFYISTMLFWFAMYTYVPILGVYIGKLGGSNRMVGIIVGSYGFVQMFLRIPLGIASDKLHRRKLFINFGLLLSLFSGLGLWTFKNLNLILIFRGMAGAAAATWVDFTVLYTSYFKHEEATKAIGIINFFNNSAQMLAMLAGGWFAENISFESTFILGAAAGVFGLIASMFIVDNFDENSEKINLQTTIEVIKDKRLLTVSVLAIMSQLLIFSTAFGFTPVYAESVGASKLQLGLLTVFSTLPGAIASLIGGTYLSRKFGEKKIIVLGFLLMGIFTLTIPFTTSIPALIITQALAGAGKGFSFPMLMGLSIKHVKRERRATAMGFFQSVYGLGMFIGPVLTGAIGDALNLEQGFILLGIVGGLTALLAIFMIKKD